jgi:hypothetical protein
LSNACTPTLLTPTLTLTASSPSSVGFSAANQHSPTPNLSDIHSSCSLHFQPSSLTLTPTTSLIRSDFSSAANQHGPTLNPSDMHLSCCLLHLQPSLPDALNTPLPSSDGSSTTNHHGPTLNPSDTRPSCHVLHLQPSSLTPTASPPLPLAWCCRTSWKHHILLIRRAMPPISSTW